MSIKIEVGKKYELNNGEVQECTRMLGSDPLCVGEYGYGPFVMGGSLYHQDGRFGSGDLDYDLSVKREWADEPEGKTLAETAVQPVAPADDQPKTWGVLPDAEKGSLLLAHHEGQVIECANGIGGGFIIVRDPMWYGDQIYRIKPTPPEPKVETVSVIGGHRTAWNMSNAEAGTDCTHRLTFTTKDGKPATGRFVNEAGDVIEMEEV